MLGAIGMVSVLAILLGVRRHRPARRLPWYLFAGGVAVLAVARELPAGGDVVQLAAYPPLAIGLILFIRLRSWGRDWASLLDGGIIAASVGLVVWTYLVLPQAPHHAWGTAVTLAMPVLDALVLTLAARLAVACGVRRLSLGLLLAGAGCLLVSDGIYGLSALDGPPDLVGVRTVGWLCFAVLAGAAALHPSMRTLSMRSPRRDNRLTVLRLSVVGLLAAAAALAPAVELFRVRGYDPLVVTIGWSVLLLLVVARMAGLIRRDEHALGRERVIRDAGAALVAARSGQEVFNAAVGAIGEVLGPAHEVRLFAIGDGGEIIRAAGPPFSLVSAAPSPSLPALPPAAQRALTAWRGSPEGLTELAAALGLGVPAQVWACPITLHRALQAFVLVTGAAPVGPDAEHAVIALVSQVALALERQELTERIERDRTDARFHSLVQHATDVVTVVAPDMTILYQSPSVERVLGYAPDHLVGTPITALLHEDDTVAALTALTGVRPGEVSVPSEFRMLHADGTWRHFEALEANLLGDPLVGGYLLSSRDVTARKQAREQEEQRQRRLEQSQRMEAIGQLAGGVAHDLNNMLAVILTYQNLVTKELGRGSVAGGSRSRAARDVERIREAATRAAALVQQLLILGRRDAVHPEVLELNTMVADLERLLRRTIGEHITLRTRLTGAPTAICADRSGIDQVLMNLVINARDAMPAGGTLTIETTTLAIDKPVAWAPELATGSYVCLGVSDTGVGMDDAVLARAMEPFFTTKPKGQGSGLGLATVYGIVRQAGGDIHLYSEPHLGTTVRVYLPASASSVPVEVPALVPATDGGGRLILLVEDEEEVREGTHRLLTESGFHVVTAANGPDALTIAQAWAGDIDLLLTDMVMPGMSGNDLARTLRDSRPGTPVLLMSGYPQDVLERSPHLEGVSILPKPFTESSLLAAVGEALAVGAR